MLPVMASRLRPLARHPIATIGWVTAAEADPNLHDRARVLATSMDFGCYTHEAIWL